MSDMEAAEGRFLSQDFGVGGPPAAPKRPLAVIEAELDMLKRDTRQKETALLCNYIEVGRRLEEAKAQLPHGQWGEWLKKMEISQSTANNFMRLFREYGEEQQSLFGAEAKSQTFGNLTYSKALQLLAITDEEERERFVIENDVEHMSVRELTEAIKARDEAEEKAAAAEDQAEALRKEKGLLQEKLDSQARVYEARLIGAGVEADQAKAAAKKAQEALDKQRNKAQRLQDALSEANTATQAAEDKCTRLNRELEELRSRPVDVAVETDTEAVEAARKAAIEEMTGKVDKAKAEKKKADERRKVIQEKLVATQKELEELKARGPEVRELTQEEKDALTAGAVERARAEDDEQIRKLKKQLATANPNVAEFKLLFTSWQETYHKMDIVLERIEKDDAERAVRLRQAVKAAREQMG